MRRGNLNEKVKIYRYVTKGTFDAYNWGLVENKQKFIGQIMTSKSPARSIEDVDATALSYAEVKMLATGDPRIKEKMDLDIQVAKLKMLKANHQAQQYETQDSIVKYYPQQIAQTQLMIDVLSGELPVLEAHPVKEDSFSMTIQDKVYTERKAAGEAIVAACKSMTDPEKPIELGEYRGFTMRLALRAGSFQVSLKHRMTYTAELRRGHCGQHHQNQQCPGADTQKSGGQQTAPCYPAHPAGDSKGGSRTALPAGGGTGGKGRKAQPAEHRTGQRRARQRTLPGGWRSTGAGGRGRTGGSG